MRAPPRFAFAVATVISCIRRAHVWNGFRLLPFDGAHKAISISLIPAALPLARSVFASSDSLCLITIIIAVPTFHNVYCFLHPFFQIVAIELRHVSIVVV